MLRPTYKAIFYLAMYVIMSTGFFVIIYHSYLLARHTLPSGKIYSKSNTALCVTGTPCTYPDEVDFRVIVITFNRPNSLSKLLRSLATLVLDGDRAALEIWIDRNKQNGVDQRTVEVASTFSWKGGSTRIHIQVALT